MKNQFNSQPPFNFTHRVWRKRDKGKIAEQISFHRKTKSYFGIHEAIVMDFRFTLKWVYVERLMPTSK